MSKILIINNLILCYIIVIATISIEIKNVYGAELVADIPGELGNERVTNCTTEPNTAGKFILWFRNETSLLVVWQPPAGVYTHYKVSIDPPDAIDSILYVEKEGDPPRTVQVTFKGLVPGRAYNISIQTKLDDKISAPITAQYRTVPSRPLNVSVDKSSITSRSFTVHWEPPNGNGEFDKYQISLISVNEQSPVTRLRDERTYWEFKDNLEPGKTYEVHVKTISGKVTSLPMAVNVTLSEKSDKNNIVS